MTCRCPNPTYGCPVCEPPAVAPNSAGIELLVEAWKYGQFSDDFNQPLAKPLRAAIRRLCESWAAGERERRYCSSRLTGAFWGPCDCGLNCDTTGVQVKCHGASEAEPCPVGELEALSREIDAMPGAIRPSEPWPRTSGVIACREAQGEHRGNELDSDRRTPARDRGTSADLRHVSGHGQQPDSSCMAGDPLRGSDDLVVGDALRAAEQPSSAGVHQPLDAATRPAAALAPCPSGGRHHIHDGKCCYCGHVPDSVQPSDGGQAK